MRFCIALSAVFLISLPCLYAQDVAPQATDADRSLIEKAAEQFVKAFNDHDAKSVAALFTEDAELVERDGTRFVGSDEIEAAFASSFEQNPNSKISLTVDSLRFVTPSVAVEEGGTAWYPDGVTVTTENTYRVAHVKRNGKWLMAGARTIDENVLSNYEYLRDLEWMVGQWVDEGGDAVVETNVRWTPDRAFLMRDFTVKMNGQPVLTGTQRIGWDSRRKQLRSWTFDSEGGYVEGFWTQVDDGWVIRSTGYLRDGAPVSGTTRVDREGKDRFVWSMFNRLRGQEIMPDVNVTIVRKPPQPAVTAE